MRNARQRTTGDGGDDAADAIAPGKVAATDRLVQRQPAAASAANLEGPRAAPAPADDPFALHLLADRDGSGGGGGVPVVQRKADPAADVAAVKSVELATAERSETATWPGVAARGRNRKRELGELLAGKVSADDKTVLTRMQTRWDATIVMKADFDPLSGAVDVAALQALIAADRADAAALPGKPYKHLREWVTKLADELGRFLELRRIVDEERVEFHRFDSDFLDAEVATLLASVPGTFRPADLKAMLAKETGDFTDTSIKGLEGKQKGVVHKLKPNPSHVGVAQLDDDADSDARKAATRLGIALPPRTAKADPRETPSSGIKIAAGYVAYVGAQLDAGLPAGRPAGAELRKLVLAGYNGGPFALIKAAGIASGNGGAYTWASIAANAKAMASFAKPGEVRDYVKSVSERAP